MTNPVQCHRICVHPPPPKKKRKKNRLPRLTGVAAHLLAGSPPRPIQPRVRPPVSSSPESFHSLTPPIHVRLQVSARKVRPLPSLPPRRILVPSRTGQSSNRLQLESPRFDFSFLFCVRASRLTRPLIPCAAGPPLRYFHQVNRSASNFFSF